MRIFNTENIELIEPDLSKGKLVSDRRFVAHHTAIDYVPDQFHYEVVKEFPNGGKEVKKVIDVPGTPAQEAWDEYEDILRFIPFTEIELADNRITELKQKLQDTDFHILKIVEGAATLSDCAEVISKRASWRKEINELEIKMNNI
jgi:hypothetical protein